MSIINDYAVQHLVQQRQADFRAEAAADRLARLATGERVRPRRIKVRRRHHRFGQIRPASAH